MSPRSAEMKAAPGISPPSRFWTSLHASGNHAAFAESAFVHRFVTK